jgi:Methyltransferase domain
LLLFRLAADSERYYGTDISQTALDFLQQQMQRPALQLPQVKLERKAAHEFDHQQMRGQFDAVVLNSIVQYFPDLDYLMTVLEGAVESVRQGGALFIGDVRSFPLLEAFHTSVEVYRADDSLSREELRQKVQKGIRQEGELLGLTGVSNARLTSDAAALEWLNSEDGSSSVGELCKHLMDISAVPAVEPEDLWKLEQVLPYQPEGLHQGRSAAALP